MVWSGLLQFSVLTCLLSLKDTWLILLHLLTTSLTGVPCWFSQLKELWHKWYTKRPFSFFSYPGYIILCFIRGEQHSFIEGKCSILTPRTNGGRQIIAYHFVKIHTYQSEIFLFTVHVSIHYSGRLWQKNKVQLCQHNFTYYNYQYLYFKKGKKDKF